MNFHLQHKFLLTSSRCFASPYSAVLTIIFPSKSIMWGHDTLCQLNPSSLLYLSDGMLFGKSSYLSCHLLSLVTVWLSCPVDICHLKIVMLDISREIRCALQLCSIACYFVQISSQKKKTGVISPRRFVQRVKKQNELFRSYMHQVSFDACCVICIVGKLTWWQFHIGSRDCMLWMIQVLVANSLLSLCIFVGCTWISEFPA